MPSASIAWRGCRERGNGLAAGRVQGEGIQCDPLISGCPLADRNRIAIAAHQFARRDAERLPCRSLPVDRAGRPPFHLVRPLRRVFPFDETPRQARLAGPPDLDFDLVLPLSDRRHGYPLWRVNRWLISGIASHNESRLSRLACFSTVDLSCPGWCQDSNICLFPRQMP